MTFAILGALTWATITALCAVYCTKRDIRRKAEWWAAQSRQHQQGRA